MTKAILVLLTLIFAVLGVLFASGLGLLLAVACLVATIVAFVRKPKLAA